MLKLPQDTAAKTKGGDHAERVDSQPSTGKTSLNTTVRHTYTGPKTLTSTGSSEGSVSTDETQSSPASTLVAFTSLKKSDVSPKQRTGCVIEPGFFTKSYHFAEAEVNINMSQVYIETDENEMRSDIRHEKFVANTDACLDRVGMYICFVALAYLSLCTSERLVYHALGGQALTSCIRS